MLKYLMGYIYLYYWPFLRGIAYREHAKVLGWKGRDNSLREDRKKYIFFDILITKSFLGSCRHRAVKMGENRDN